MPMAVHVTNILFAQIVLSLQDDPVEKSTVPCCVSGSLPALLLVHHQSLCMWQILRPETLVDVLV